MIEGSIKKFWGFNATFVSDMVHTYIDHRADVMKSKSKFILPESILGGLFWDLRSF
jgi:hypothetical protein